MHLPKIIMHEALRITATTFTESGVHHAFSSGLPCWVQLQAGSLDAFLPSALGCQVPSAQSCP